VTAPPTALAVAARVSGHAARLPQGGGAPDPVGDRRAGRGAVVAHDRQRDRVLRLSAL